VGDQDLVPRRGNPDSEGQKGKRQKKSEIRTNRESLAARKLTLNTTKDLLSLDNTGAAPGTRGTEKSGVGQDVLRRHEV